MARLLRNHWHGQTEIAIFLPVYDSILITPTFDPNKWSIKPAVRNINSKFILENSLDGKLYDSFCIYPILDTCDLTITFFSQENPRPGFENCYKILAINEGTQIKSDTIKLFYQNDYLKLASASESPIYNENGELRWLYDNFKPFEKLLIDVCFRVNSPMDTPPLNNGDSIKFKAIICPIEGDMNPEDNVATLCQEVRNSYDPNDKQCLEGTTLTPAMLNGYIHYMIRFENLGTAEAVNIVVRDIIDTSTFDVNSFYTIDASHSPYTTTIYDNRIVEFEFKDIYLPFDDDNNDGYVVFAIKPKDHITIGDSLSNQADIYFDFNFPITTNDAISVVRDFPTFVPKFDNTLDVTAYPNPTIDQITVIADGPIESISITTLDGRIIRQVVYINESNPLQEVNLGGLPVGVYLCTVQSKEKIGTVRIIKSE